MKLFLMFFGVEFIGFLLACLNMRGVALHSYSLTLCTDAVIIVNAFYSLRLFLKDPESKMAVFGATLGGVSGSALALYLT